VGICLFGAQQRRGHTLASIDGPDCGDGIGTDLTVCLRGNVERLMSAVPAVTVFNPWNHTVLFLVIRAGAPRGGWLGGIPHRLQRHPSCGISYTGDSIEAQRHLGRSVHMVFVVALAPPAEFALERLPRSANVSPVLGRIRYPVGRQSPILQPSGASIVPCLGGAQIRRSTRLRNSRLAGRGNICRFFSFL